jgi:beta-galactosamide-alpha-2,3-sialyltransferase
MLIAEKLIENNPSYENDFICMYYDENEKYNYYYNRLKDKCQNSTKFLISDNGGIVKLLELIKLKFLLGKEFRRDYDIISFASIDSFFIHYICSKLNFKKIETFDDGAANFFKKGHYYAQKEYSLFARIVKNIFNIEYDMDILINSINKHYTICEDLKNIVDNTVFLSLFDYDVKSSKNEGIISIFLGQPFHEYNLENEIDVECILKKLDISLYYPHPREKKTYLNVNNIVSNKIFEDYVSELRLNGYVVKVYAFLSTALLNLNGQNGVECFLIYNSDLYEKYKELYQIYTEANIEVINLENII